MYRPFNSVFQTNMWKAIGVLMMPSGGIPASVTPKCNGTSGRSAAKRRLNGPKLEGRYALPEGDSAALQKYMEDLQKWFGRHGVHDVVSESDVDEEGSMQKA